MFQALATRVGDPKTNVVITKDRIEFTALQAKVESLEIDQEQVKSLTLQAIGLPSPETAEANDGSGGIDSALVELADNYMKINIADWTERVRAKDAAAREMANLIITKAISRELLAGQHHEGLIIALAATIHAFPQEGDIGHILRVADEANRLHVKYRIVLALGRLAERGLVTKSDMDRVRDVLALYKKDADAPLLRRINQTEVTMGFVSAGTAQ